MADVVGAGHPAAAWLDGKSMTDDQGPDRRFKADADENGGPRLSSTEKKELAELQRKNRLLEQETRYCGALRRISRGRMFSLYSAFRLVHELAAATARSTSARRRSASSGGR